MISYFDRVIEYLLEQKEIGKAVALLSSLNETMDSIMMKDRQIFAIQRILQNSSVPFGWTFGKGNERKRRSAFRVRVDPRISSTPHDAGR